MNLKRILLSLLVLVLFSCKSPTTNLELSDGFAAFIVKDIQQSITWYNKSFGFELINETHLEDRGIKMANLGLGNTKIELIESATVIDPLDNQKGLVLGIFKVGYVVSNFDAWKDHLLNLGLISERLVVTDPVTNIRTLIITDPDGNRIQLFEKQ